MHLHLHSEFNVGFMPSSEHISNAEIHNIKMLEDRSAAWKWWNRPRDQEKDAITKWNILRCDFKVLRLGIKSRLEAELELKEEEEPRSQSVWGSWNRFEWIFSNKCESNFYNGTVHCHRSIASRRWEDLIIFKKLTM